MKNFLAIMVSLITLSSCQFYKPAMMHVPILEKRGELNLGGSIGSGTDVNAAYAISNHIAASASLTSNIITGLYIGSGQEETFEAKNMKYDFALGYFNSKEGSFNYNFFAGYSAGQTSGLLNAKWGWLTLDNSSASAKYSSFFVQGAGSIYIGGDSYLGLVAKVNSLEFDKFNYNRIVDNTNEYFASNKSQIVGQIGWQYNLKLEKFGITTQVQYAFTPSTDAYFTIRNMGLHAGVYFRLDEMFKK